MQLETQRNLALAALLVVAVGAGGYWLGQRSAAPAVSRGADAAGVPGTAPVPVPLAPPTPDAAAFAASTPAAAPAAPPTTFARRDDSESWRERAPQDDRAGGVASATEPTAGPAAAEESQPAATGDPGGGSEAPAEREPEVVVLAIPSGTKIEVRLLRPVSSQTARLDDEVVAELAAPVTLEGVVALPAGTPVQGRVNDVKALAKIGGQARLGIAFESVRVHERQLPIVAAWARQGKSETGKDVAAIAAGAVLGTILGNQAKHNDRGKAIGAAAGAGVGTAIAAGTEGETVDLGEGAELTVTLREGLEVTVTR